MKPFLFLTPGKVGINYTLFSVQFWSPWLPLKWFIGLNYEQNTYRRIQNFNGNVCKNSDDISNHSNSIYLLYKDDLTILIKNLSEFPERRKLKLLHAHKINFKFHNAKMCVC